MEIFEELDGKVYYEEVSPEVCSIDEVKDVLAHTGVRQALVVHGITGKGAFPVLKKFLEDYEEYPVLYVIKDVAKEDKKNLPKLNQISEQVNILTCVGFEDVSAYVEATGYRVLLYKNKAEVDFLTRLFAYFAGAFMAGSSYTKESAEEEGAHSIHMRIFANCFGGGANARVIDFMIQMCNALGHGKISEAIRDALRSADKIRQYTAEDSNVFN